MFIYLVGLFYIGKYLIFSFVACFSKLYCLFVIVQTLYFLNFDSPNIAIMSGDNYVDWNTTRKIQNIDRIFY